MIKVLFFARLKEQVGEAELMFEYSNKFSTVSHLTDALMSRSHQYRDALSQSNILVAVNHEMVTNDCFLKDGDEIAYFPPVTGG